MLFAIVVVIAVLVVGCVWMQLRRDKRPGPPDPAIAEARAREKRIWKLIDEMDTSPDVHVD